ncbi:hypothetical protein CHLRE_17g746397v5 [Chlamydomonas reinhardtii]|uniref:PsbP C-terminal domain-containing protein n=1 Tax=Chlamydomonas reinhardtii TaxID=3055 RepID=A0A2K3CS50_CHLRE|nr:uncharacterized protein CHLRE_17g746397v5 [Chlamydomonas reinhardtii]PNW71095.1 hypothetical protein CHLRE_17g746397v5 [Chlamydomonas reinhardtii]
MQRGLMRHRRTGSRCGVACPQQGATTSSGHRVPRRTWTVHTSKLELAASSAAGTAALPEAAAAARCARDGSSGSSSGSSSSSRRGALLQLASASAAGAWSLTTAGRARADTDPLPKTCTGPDLLLPYADPSGRFRLAVPCGWRQVTSLMPGGSVLASFYNPEEPGAETLAVYVAAAPEGVRRTADLGPPEEVAAGLAGIAPNGLVMGSYGSSRGGRQYVTVHVQFGGNTAGVFGAAREFRAITVDQGLQYTLRVTSTRYRYLAHARVRQLLAGAADGFELLRA